MTSRKAGLREEKGWEKWAYCDPCPPHASFSLSLLLSRSRGEMWERGTVGSRPPPATLSSHPWWGWLLVTILTISTHSCLPKQTLCPLGSHKHTHIFLSFALSLSFSCVHKQNVRFTVTFKHSRTLWQLTTGTEIYPNTRIQPHAVIYPNTAISKNSIIYPKTIIDPNTRIYPNSGIYQILVYNLLFTQILQ